MVKIRKARKTRKRKMRGGAGSGGPRRIVDVSKVDFSKELAALRQRLVALNDGQPVGFTEKGLAHLKNRLRKLTGDRLTERDNILLKELQKKLDNINKIKSQLDADANLDKNLAAARRAAERAAFAAAPAEEKAAGKEDYVMVRRPGSMGPRRTVGSNVAATATKAAKAIGSLFRRNKRGGAKSRKRKRTRRKRRKSRKGVTRRKRR